MIIKALLDLVYGVFSILTSAINIPALPSAVSGFLGTAIDYMSFGAGFLSAWVDTGYLFGLFKIVLSVEAGTWLYKIVMYVIRKIPFFGIK